MTTPPSPSSSSRVPASRLRLLNGAPFRPEGRYLVYWMVAARRPRYSFALERACELARQHNKPLIIFEPLRVGYRWASDRIHRFVIEGMRELPGRRYAMPEGKPALPLMLGVVARRGEG